MYKTRCMCFDRQIIICAHKLDDLIFAFELFRKIELKAEKWSDIYHFQLSEAFIIHHLLPLLSAHLFL